MIYTFYSYKGGVGRSMALVNIAELMYRQGLRVLMVDWDLEAPGLERFYSDHVDEALGSPGVIDMLLYYKNRAARFEPEAGVPLLPADEVNNYLINLHPDIEGSGQLWLLPAGYRAGDQFLEYANRVKTFDWQDFYLNWEGEPYFEWLRSQLLELADVVLIDSRTGVTEMGGVCTYQLADVVVMLCAPNAQNIDGTMQMLSSFIDTRLTDLRHGRKLVPLVIPARVERVSELTKLNTFRQEFTSRFQRHLPADLEDDPDAFIRFEIPYVPLYAFEEIVAVDQSGTKQRAVEMELAYSSILLAMANLAASDSVLKTQLGPRLSELVEADKLRMSQEQAKLDQIQRLITLGDYAAAYALSEQGQAAAVSQQSMRGFSGLRSNIATRWVRQTLERYRAAIEDRLGDDALRPLVGEMDHLITLELPMPLDLASDLIQAHQDSRRRLRYLEIWEQIEAARELGLLEQALELANSAFAFASPQDSVHLDDLVKTLTADIRRHERTREAIDMASRLAVEGRFQAAAAALSLPQISSRLQTEYRRQEGLLLPLAQAEAAEERGDWRQALDMYRERLDTSGELRRVLERRIERCQAQFTHSRKQRSVESIIARGLAALKEADYSIAETQFKQALSIDPQNDVALDGLAQTLRRAGDSSERAGDYHSAVAYYESLLALNPDDTEIQQRLHSMQPRLAQEKRETRRRTHIQLWGSILVLLLIASVSSVLTLFAYQNVFQPLVARIKTITATSTATNTPTATVTPASTPSPSSTELEPSAGLPEPFLGQTRTETTVYSSATGDSVVGSLSPSTTVNLCALAGTRYLISLGPCDLSEPLGWVDVFGIQSLSSLPFPAELITPMPSATPTATLSPTPKSAMTPTVVATPTPTSAVRPTGTPAP